MTWGAVSTDGDVERWRGREEGRVCGPAPRDTAAGTELDRSPDLSQPLGCTV